MLSNIAPEISRVCGVGILEQKENIFCIVESNTTKGYLGTCYLVVKCRKLSLSNRYHMFTEAECWCSIFLLEMFRTQSPIL